jgi:hypothetical protein
MNSPVPQNPIFIVGSPRSGTTLLQSLITTQPGIYSFPETHYFSVIEKQATPDPAIETIDGDRLGNALETIEKKLELTLSKEEVEYLKALVQQRRLTSKALFESIVIHHLTRQKVTLDPPDSFRWVEKTPTHCNFLHRIFALYPAARVLHIVRHPVPAIFSRKELFPTNKHTPLEELAHGWRRMQANVRRHQQEKPQLIKSLRYEDLVERLQDTMEKIGTFLEIDLDPRLLRNHHRQATALTLGSEPWKQNAAAHAIANTNHRYKGIVKAPEAERIETIATEQMAFFGYKTFFDDND